MNIEYAIYIKKYKLLLGVKRGVKENYEIQKNYKCANWTFYLPADTSKNAKQFVKIVKPIKVIFIKYEFWFNYMRECKKQKIPFYSVSSVFREEHFFFKHKWFVNQLKNITHFFVQDNDSAHLLESLGIDELSSWTFLKAHCISNDGTIIAGVAQNSFGNWVTFIIDLEDELGNDLLGDVNADSSVDILDVVMLVNYILNSETSELDGADINNDGNVNVLDIVELVNIILTN